MTLSPSTAGAVMTDPAGYGGKSLLMWSNSTATGSLTSSTSASQIVVSARGDQCSGAPQMVVILDGVTVLTKSVSNSGDVFANYSAPVSAGAGAHTVQVKFTNDFNTGCDRNLWVNTISLNASSTADAGAPVTDAGTSTTPGPFIYGMNDHPQWLTAPAQNQFVSYLVKAGVRSIRVDMSWANIEQTGKGQYNATYVARWDNFIAQCKAHNIDVLGILLDTPGWANGNKISPATNSSRVVPPSDLSATGFQGGPGSQNYNDYVGFVMDRWGIHGSSASGTKWIKNWEVWNEPDGYWAWSEATGTTSPVGAGKSDPVKYAQLLKGAYKYIKAKDPTATVLGVSTSGAPLWTPNGDWVEVLYQQGIKGYFDVFSAHVYNSIWNPAPEPVPAPPETVLARITNHLLPILANHGDASKPMWITETGYYTGGPNNKAQVTEAQQADFLTRAFAYAHKNMPNVKGLYWYEFTSSNTGTSDQGYYGIVRGTPFPNGLADPWPVKPAFTAFEGIDKSQ
jgi:hypothetical protein